VDTLFTDTVSGTSTTRP